MDRTLLKILIGFAAFWCLLTGVAAAAQVYRGCLVWDVRHRFAPTTAVVLASAVEATCGSEGTTNYRPVIRYRYRVEAHDYESDRYDVQGAGASGDQAWSSRVVAANPPGAVRPIWYDPDRPESAVVERGWPRNYWFIWLFLQPFLVIGATLLVSIVVVVRWRRARRRCLAGVCGPGWCVPGWGTFSAAARGLRIGGGHDLGATIGFAAATYAGLTFVSVFPMGFLGGGAEDAPWGRDGRVVAVLVGAFIATAVGVGVRTYRRRTIPELSIDERHRQVTLRTGPEAISGPWNAIRGWAVQRSVREDSESGPSFTYAVTLGMDGSAPVKVFSTESAEVAVHAAEQLAAATASSCLIAPGDAAQFKRDQRRTPS